MCIISGMDTDEYQISLNREIGVCRSMMASAQKELQRFEKTYGLSSGQFISGENGSAGIPEKESLRWREEIAAVSVWSDRLRQYEELYNNSRM